MYEIFEHLLQIKGVSTYKVAKETGIPQQTFSKWKKGISTPKADKLQKIADYFGVTIDYLLGNTDDINQKPGQDNIKFDDFSYAMYNESKELSEADKQRLLTFARMLRETIEKEEHLNGNKQ